MGINIFIMGKGYSVNYRGPVHHSWKGGRNKNKQGYIVLRIDGKYVLEHRLVMAQHIGRPLLSEEEVHHINGVRDDNRLENLELCASMSDHMRHHRKQVEYPIINGSKQCSKCRVWKELAGFTVERAAATGYCLLCRECKREKLEDWRANNREKYLQDRKTYYRKTYHSVAKAKI